MALYFQKKGGMKKMNSPPPVEEPKLEPAMKPEKLASLAPPPDYDPLKSKYSRLQAQFRKRF